MSLLKQLREIGYFLFLALFTLSVQAAPSNWPPPGLEIAQEAINSHGNDLILIDGVIGHGITVDGDGEAAIVVFTATPMLQGIPRTLDGVSIVVRFSGQFYALAPPKCGGPPAGRPAECFDDSAPSVDPTARFDRPVPIGVSTGHPDITAGTIGARVIGINDDSTDAIVDNKGKIFALSNNHVFANSNAAVLGDNILQPGPFDGGTSSDAYGTLSAFIPIIFSDSTNYVDNYVDAALAETDTSQLTNTTPEDGYGSPVSTTSVAVVGQSVQKYGRTTGFTQGRVEAINATVNVCYESDLAGNCVKLAHFVDQIVISDGQFSEGGDSGSLIVTTDGNQPMALLFAGSPSYTIASPIDTVLSVLGVAIDGEEVTPPPPSGEFALTATGYKVKGWQHTDLTWSGVVSSDVDIWRDGSLIITTINDGFYTDPINQKGSGSYNYQVCEAETDNCSNEAVVEF